MFNHYNYQLECQEFMIHIQSFKLLPSLDLNVVKIRVASATCFSVGIFKLRLDPCYPEHIRAERTRVKYCSHPAACVFVFDAVNEQQIRVKSTTCRSFAGEKTHTGNKLLLFSAST